MENRYRQATSKMPGYNNPAPTENAPVQDQRPSAGMMGALNQRAAQGLRGALSQYSNQGQRTASGQKTAASQGAMSSQSASSQNTMSGQKTPLGQKPVTENRQVMSNITYSFPEVSKEKEEPFSRERLQEAVIWTEILGKPVCKRRGRRH